VQFAEGKSNRRLLAPYLLKERILQVFSWRVRKFSIDDAQVKCWFEATSLMGTRLETKY
jgi:hypothetical protein